jgi:hypothetical protein
MISTDFETSRQVTRRLRPERSRLLSARRALGDAFAGEVVKLHPEV